MSTVDRSPRDSAGNILIVDDEPCRLGIIGHAGGVGMAVAMAMALVSTGGVILESPPSYDNSKRRTHPPNYIPVHERHQGSKERMRRLKKAARPSAGYQEGAGGFSGCTHEDGNGYCNHPSGVHVDCEAASAMDVDTLDIDVMCLRAI